MKKLKELKVATIYSLPEIIKKGRLIEDEVENMHGDNDGYHVNQHFKVSLRLD